MKKKMLTAATTLSVAAALVGGLAQRGSASLAHTQTTSYRIRAVLDRKHQVPAPKDAVAARGVLTGKLTLAGKRSSFTWELTLSGLSGRVVAAEVALGKPGKAGPTAIQLCNKCRVNVRGGYTGPYVANKAFVTALLHGDMYATVMTKLNPKGEIRGQIKASTA